MLCDFDLLLLPLFDLDLLPLFDFDLLPHFDEDLLPPLDEDLLPPLDEDLLPPFEDDFDFDLLPPLEDDLLPWLQPQGGGGGGGRQPHGGGVLPQASADLPARTNSVGTTNAAATPRPSRRSALRRDRPGCATFIAEPSVSGRPMERTGRRRACDGMEASRDPSRKPRGIGGFRRPIDEPRRQPSIFLDNTAPDPPEGLRRSSARPSSHEKPPRTARCRRLQVQRTPGPTPLRIELAGISSPANSLRTSRQERTPAIARRRLNPASYRDPDALKTTRAVSARIDRSNHSERRVT